MQRALVGVGEPVNEALINDLVSIFANLLQVYFIEDLVRDSHAKLATSVAV